MRTPMRPEVLTARSLSLAMHRRTFLKGMAGVAGAAVLGGCSSAREGGGEVDGTTLRVRAWTDFGYPTPFTYTAGPGYWKQSLIFDTLTWPDSTGDQLPWLASSYRRSEDGLTYTVELRDVSWSDGRPLTARDVAFTYEYYTVVNPATGKAPVFTPLLIGVPRKGTDVVPLGDRTVEFRLPRPDATFVQYVLGTMPIVPEHVWSTNDNPMAARDPRFLVGTGAYTLQSRNVSEDVEVYVANDRYFLGRPFVRRIDMLGSEDPLTTLRVGELDGTSTEVEGATNELLAPFRDNSEYAILSKEGAWGFPLFFNLDKGGALRDVRFRRACLHALNRDDIVRRLLTGNGKPGSAGFVSPDSAYYNPDTPQYPFDSGEAERLLDEAGYRRTGGNGMRTNPDGGSLRYALKIPALVPVALAELVADNLKRVGIDVELRRVELVQLFGMKTSGDYDLLMTSFPGPAGTGPAGDPEFLRGIYHTPADPKRPPMQYATGYSNPEVDRLLDEQLATVDFETRKRLVGDIQRIVADDLPVAMLYYPTLYYIYRPKVFDQWYYTPGGFGPGIDTDVYNKQAYITGRTEGTEVRP